MIDLFVLFFFTITPKIQGRIRAKISVKSRPRATVTVRSLFFNLVSIPRSLFPTPGVKPTSFSECPNWHFATRCFWFTGNVTEISQVLCELPCIALKVMSFSWSILPSISIIAPTRVLKIPLSQNVQSQRLNCAFSVHRSSRGSDLTHDGCIWKNEIMAGKKNGKNSWILHSKMCTKSVEC